MSSIDAKCEPDLDPARRLVMLRDMAVLLAACVVLFWLGNARTGLWDRDEARYAQASAMMLHDGDWIVPKYFEYQPQPEYDRYRPRYHKPILIYWLQATAFAVLGKTAFAARFFGGLFAAGTVLCTYWLGLQMFGRRVGRLAAVMLATCLWMQVESRLGTVDAPLLFFTTWSTACLWNVLEGKGSRRNALCYWIALGLGFLSKGPVIALFVVPLLAVAVWQWWSKRRVFAAMHPLWGVPVFLAIAAPWFLVINHVTGGEYLSFVSGDLFGRATRAMEGHYYFPGFYAVVWMVGLFPWAPLLPVTVLWGITKRGRDARFMLLLVGGFLLPRLLLELPRTQMFHYALPTIPAACLLLAPAAGSGFGHGKRLWHEMEGKLALVLLAAACLLGAVGMPLAFGLTGLTAALPAAIGLGLCTAGLGLLGCWHIVRGSFSRAGVWQMAGAAVISCLVLGGWLIPSLEPYRLARKSAEAALMHADGAGRVVLLGWEEPSTVFYLGREDPSRVWIAKQRKVPRRSSDGELLLDERGDPRMKKWGLTPLGQILDYAERTGLEQIVIVSPDRQSELLEKIPSLENLTPDGVWGVNWPKLKRDKNGRLLIHPLYVYRVPARAPATGAAASRREMP